MKCSWFPFSTASTTYPSPISTIFVAVIIISAVVGSLETDGKDGLYSTRLPGSSLSYNTCRRVEEGKLNKEGRWTLMKYLQRTQEAVVLRLHFPCVPSEDKADWAFIPLHPLIACRPPTCMCAKSLQSCLTLCDPMDHNPPGSPVHGILQARLLEWVAKPSSRGSSWLRDPTCISYISCIGKGVVYHWCLHEGGITLGKGTCGRKLSCKPSTIYTLGVGVEGWVGKHLVLKGR